MKKIIVVVILYFSTSIAFSQSVGCNDLYDFIVKNGTRKASLASYTLNSSWLTKVTAYTYEYKIYVIAEIKPEEYSFKTSSYIFCGIPSQNWNNFQYGGYGESDSYGERFHKYIIDYKCNCN